MLFAQSYRNMYLDSMDINVALLIQTVDNNPIL